MYQSSNDQVLVVYRPICVSADTVLVSSTLGRYLIDNLPIVCRYLTETRSKLGLCLSVLTTEGLAGSFCVDLTARRNIKPLENKQLRLHPCSRFKSSFCTFCFWFHCLTSPRSPVWAVLNPTGSENSRFWTAKAQRRKREFGFVFSYVWITITDTLNRGKYVGGDRALDKSCESFKTTSYYLFYCTTTTLHWKKLADSSPIVDR